MAIATKCQTQDACYHIDISDSSVSCSVQLPLPLDLTEEEAELLEANIHNAMELALAPYFLHSKRIK